MLYSVKGELLHAEPKMAVVCCGGVGFRLQITMNTARQLPSIGGEVMLYTYMNVREDAIELFGFAQREERDLFRRLISVAYKAALARNGYDVSLLFQLPVGTLYGVGING